MTSHVATVLAVLAGCQRVHREVEPPRIDTPAVTTETAAIRSTATARDPSPPPATAVTIPSDLGWLSPEQKSRFLALAPAQRRYVEQFCRWQQFDCTRFRLGASASAELALAYPLVLARHVGASVDSAESYCRTEPPGFREMRCRTPLVVAFDAQPVELLPATRPFAFTRGEPATSAWPTAATPWIALDRDGDGAITSGAELFGDGVAGAHDGFAALAILDANGDEVIDARDPAFARLLLWADADGDRQSAPGELRALSAVITAIPLAHEGVRGSARLRDGRTADVIDLYLATSQ